MPEEWLEVKDIAYELRVGADTVRKYLNTPDGMPATLIGTSYRIKKTDFEKWKRTREGRKKKI